MSLGPPLTRHLTDCFAELLAYVETFRQTAVEKQPSYEVVRNDILRLLKESESFVTKGFCTPEDYDLARYAVCAWIDESVLASAWNFKGRWRPELLQRVYYHSADAGEKFFQRLKNLEAHQQAVREVYYLCLALGFKGRYCETEDVYALQQLKERHLKLLFNSVSEGPTLAAMERNTLFPEAYSHGSLPQRPRIPRSIWIWTSVLAGPALFSLFLFLIYRFTLYNVGENIVRAVRS